MLVIIYNAKHSFSIGSLRLQLAVDADKCVTVSDVTSGDEALLVV